MRRSAAVIALAALAAAALLALPALAATSDRAVVSTRSTTLGRVLVDRHHRTLYLFQRDRHGKSSCYGSCARVWKPLTTRGKAATAGGVKRSRLGTTRRRGGARQVTYAHHPLYTYAGDSRAGDVNGQRLDQFGARWYALSTTGRRITHAARPAPSPSPDYDY